MNQAIRELIAVSRHFGKQKSFAIAGGGNTSWKDHKHIWVKASGFPLADIDEKGFVALDREKLKLIGAKDYSSDPDLRDNLVRADLEAAIINPSEGKRPSVETSFHELIEYPYVVHTHSTHVNMLMCSSQAASLAAEWFGNEAMYVPYALGFDLFKKVQSGLAEYRGKYPCDPRIILLQNHGVFVSGNTAVEIRQTYESMVSRIGGFLKDAFRIEELPLDRRLKEILPALRMLMKSETIPVLRIRHNTLHRHFYLSAADFTGAAGPFTPDMVVYTGRSYTYLENVENTGLLIEEFRLKYESFLKKYANPPKIILIKDMGLVAAGHDSRMVETALDIYEDLMMVSLGSGKFGGPNFLTAEQAAFIDNWEAEKYRRAIARNGSHNMPMGNKTAIVTGAARGFGRGIATDLYLRGANVVLADLLAAEGRELADELNVSLKPNDAVYFHTDVARPDSVEEMVFYTVCSYGGIDLLISNAGILKAGGLDEMDEESFDQLTRVNYSGYFYCAKYVSEVMKVQASHHDSCMADIIQINSKSGLAGSNRNFAYAGGKFGGIGLTQSFAFELAPYRIKVNAVCPGNFFEGPLWSDPENGLFVQYLRTGKVPGAKTIEDVKDHYEKMVPLGRGCLVEDVLKAIYYIISQEYETGQAVPVTGGQIMLS